jgi:Asp-tRNA(Asn)/Glu-tRNA(Gln) amidotransferase A subunit family amidase
LEFQKAGYIVHRLPAMNDIEAIIKRHNRLVAAEMARGHRDWFAQYESLYRPLTAAAIREGQQVSEDELEACRAGRNALRSQLASLMRQASIDLWVCPAAPGPAPEGITTTGSSLMNLPWTHAGMPAITLPAGHATNGLPLGLQITGPVMADEKLVSWAERLAEFLDHPA